jgi:hypothetical protein
MLFALSQGVSAQPIANQSLEERLNMLMRVVDEQQRQIQSLERQVTNLEMSQRGRGMPGSGAPAGSEAVAEQPGADGLPMPLPPLAQVTPGAPAPGNATGTATGVPVNPRAGRLDGGRLAGHDQSERTGKRPGHAGRRRRPDAEGGRARAHPG